MHRSSAQATSFPRQRSKLVPEHARSRLAPRGQLHHRPTTSRDYDGLVNRPTSLRYDQGQPPTTPECLRPSSGLDRAKRRWHRNRRPQGLSPPTEVPRRRHRVHQGKWGHRYRNPNPQVPGQSWRYYDPTRSPAAPRGRQWASRKFRIPSGRETEEGRRSGVPGGPNPQRHPASDLYRPPGRDKWMALHSGDHRSTVPVAL